MLFRTFMFDEAGNSCTMFAGVTSTFRLFSTQIPAPTPASVSMSETRLPTISMSFEKPLFPDALPPAVTQMPAAWSPGVD